MGKFREKKIHWTPSEAVGALIGQHTDKEKGEKMNESHGHMRLLNKVIENREGESPIKR